MSARRGSRARHCDAIVLIAMLGVATACGQAIDDTPGRGTGPAAGWPAYGGDAGGSRYSPLSDITPHTVGALRVAWTYHTGESPDAATRAHETAFQATPILDDGTLYLCSPDNRVHAVDAETGAGQFVYDPRIDYRGSWSLTCRGVALWRGPASEDGICTRRVFVGTMDARLIAIDASSGQVCRDFGREGEVDLLVGLGEVQDAEAYPTSPPLVVGDVVVIGGLVADNRRVDPPGGVIRAYDVRTGALRWAFDPVPPDVAPLAPDPAGTQRFHRGTPNAWSILSADLERGLVFVPFGGPSPDFFGGLRHGFDYFGSSLVALDARTGESVWRFQTVHHDLWDYDVPAQPMLIDVEKDGRRIAAVAQATKMGHIFLLDRETGVPLYPVEERPVPQTDVPGEWTSPTQPFPTFPEPTHPHRLDDEASPLGITPLDRWLCERTLADLRNEGIFTPPSLQGSIQYPGTAGGVDWGGMAWDPERQLLVMAQNRIAQVQTVVPREQLPGITEADRPDGLLMQHGTPYYTRTQVFLTPFGTPCSPLPWGTLLAVDLTTGKKAWEVPLGTTRDLVPWLPAMELGLPHMGGPISTAGGVVFIGAAMDDSLRAYSSETGEKLLEVRLPAGAQATPMTYRLRDDGPQFVVIAAGGHATLGTTHGDHLIAFTLP